MKSDRDAEASRIRIKRVYEPASRNDGVRILVERLWPRGMKKSDLQHDGWLKDVAPSPPLRTWYGHDPRKWETFRKRYIAELHRSGAWRPLLEVARRRRLTLLYSARDEEKNSAVVLQKYLLRRLKS